MSFSVTVLGSSSATPAYGRFPTAQLLDINDRYYLIDCGEGTQMQLNRYKFRWSRIDHIFISHLHGDHYLGLMGLISTMHLNGRTKELYIFGPPYLKEIIDLNLMASGTVLRFELKVVTLSALQPYLIFENSDITVHTIVLQHRIHCTGFLIKEKQKRRGINYEACQELGVTAEWFVRLKDGEDYVSETGELIGNKILTNDPRVPKSYAFCSDTIFLDSFTEQIKGVDLLYHEATFLHDLLPRAQETFHTTALQAAHVAQNADAKKLLIGHFSSRYSDASAHLAEAQTVFINTVAAYEGNTYVIG